jgi:hypothetical protein
MDLPWAAGYVPACGAWGRALGRRAGLLCKGDRPGGWNATGQAGGPEVRIAFACLCLAALLGAWLAVQVLKPDAPRPAGLLRAAHGGLAAAGLGLLLWAIGRAGGWAMFGPDGGLARSGLVLVTAALPLGLLVWLGWQRLGRAANLVLILHVFVAFTGIVLLSGWYLAG